MEKKRYVYNSEEEPVKVSKPNIHKFEPKWFESVGLHEFKAQGYVIEIVFDPKEHAAFIAQRNAELAAAQKELEEQKRQEEKELEEQKRQEEKELEKKAMRDAIIEELKESGVIPTEPKKAAKK